MPICYLHKTTLRSRLTLSRSVSYNGALGCCICCKPLRYFMGSDRLPKGIYTKFHSITIKMFCFFHNWRKLEDELDDQRVIYAAIIM